jgi:hypothetical protein
MPGCFHNALALGGTNTTLIALWDRKGGDGPGGTQHMVESAGERAPHDNPGYQQAVRSLALSFSRQGPRRLLF